MDESSSPEGNAITLKIKFKSASLDDFVARYGADVSAGGIFIRTKQPLAVGTVLHFDFTLGDGAPWMAGLGTVVWVREADASRVGSVPGMGVRFDQLTPEAQRVHQQILVVKAQRQERAAGTAPIPTSPFPLASTPGAHPSTPSAPAARPSPHTLQAHPGTPVPQAAARSSAAAPVEALFKALDGDSDDDFSGGKTEIADRPPSFFFDAVGKRPAGTSLDHPASEIAAPAAPFYDERTDSQRADDSGTGIPLQPVDLGEVSGGLSGSIELLDDDSKANEVTGASSAAIDNLSPAMDRSAAPPLVRAGAAPSKLGRESSWLSDAFKATSDEGAVPEVAPNEATQQTPVGPDATVPETPALTDDIAAVAASDDMAVEGDLSETPTAEHGTRSGKSGKKLIIVGSVAACTAFAGVYIWMTKPWEKQAAHFEALPATPAAPKEAAPSPPAAQPATPAAMPAAAEPAETTEPAKAAPTPVPEKPVAAAVAEKPRVLAAEPAKPEPTSEPGKRSGASGKKPQAKVAAASTILPSTPPPAPVPASADADESAATAIPAELVYFLKIKSVPVGAHVIMDGDPMGTTPFQRRILDIDKPHSIMIRKPGFDSYERNITKADFGPPTGNTSTLRISAKLTKLKAPPGEAAPVPEEATPAPAPAPEQPEKL